MRIVKSIKPIMKIGRTSAIASNQGYTYNESGLTYNESGVMYGGKYGSDIYPIISRSTFQRPSLIVGRTNKQLEDQGYTYNEAGFSYNQSGVAYGGLYKYDIYPIISRARLERPSIIGIRDIYTKTTPSQSGMLIG